MIPIVLAYDDPRAPQLVVEALETGLTIVFPTDTIYGIGGNPWDDVALEKVRRLKGRAIDQPFTLHLASLADLEAFAALDERRRAWVESLFPGPYTLLLPARVGAPISAVRNGTIGVRVPNHPFFARVMAPLGRPLFGTSVNPHGLPPLADVDDIIDHFPSIDLILTGPIGGGPSDILDMTADPPRAVRGTLPPQLRMPGGESPDPT
ncbi:MAG: L-threonylcarbamoyladenylate synthase [Candidatus Bipolaricaulis sp.]|nr:L-threonylcarbamoyladenylate synthase [Candidatus Bipolaricaulis sp.]MDD5645990.1 L-threonylcarbamoyladenylate synthase [Candidatus Bipolaricaulis sp.]